MSWSRSPARPPVGVVAVELGPHQPPPPVAGVGGHVLGLAARGGPRRRGGRSAAAGRRSTPPAPVRSVTTVHCPGPPSPWVITARLAGPSAGPKAAAHSSATRADVGRTGPAQGQAVTEVDRVGVSLRRGHRSVTVAGCLPLGP